MQKYQKVTKSTVVKIVLSWLPVAILFEGWLLSGASLSFMAILMGLMVSCLGGFTTWQLVRMDQIARDEHKMQQTVRDAQSVICDTCPFKMMARTSPFYDEGYKRGGAQEEATLPLPVPSKTSTSTSSEAPVLSASPR